MNSYIPSETSKKRLSSQRIIQKTDSSSNFTNRKVLQELLKAVSKPTIKVVYNFKLNPERK